MELDVMLVQLLRSSQEKSYVVEDLSARRSPTIPRHCQQQKYCTFLI